MPSWVFRCLPDEIGWLRQAWEIYLCAEAPAGQSTVNLTECACETCILDPRSVA